MTDNRTREQKEADYKLTVYGKCCQCKKPFEYGEESFRFSKVVKCSSGGQPDTYEKGVMEFHADCFVQYMKEL